MSNNLKQRLYKLAHWEFWSFNAIYFPILWYYAWLSLKAKSFFFWNAANPTIRYGGFLMESKAEIYPLLPSGTYPASILVSKSAPLQFALETASAIRFPLIAKPDIGCRGRGVAILQNESMVANYHATVPVDYLLQELVPYENEVGIFYVRNPKTREGQITGIVEKQMLTVVGDGASTIQQLLFGKQRHAIYAPDILKQIGNQAKDIPAMGESVLLVPFGNHARGAIFIDASHKSNVALELVIDNLSKQIPEFHYGRLDIRFHSWDELYKGNKFSIIELNGAGSEPTHMYDPSHSLWHAWMCIIHHWNWLYEISKANKKRGFQYLSLKEGKAMFAANKAYDALLDPFIFQSGSSSQ